MSALLTTLTIFIPLGGLLRGLGHPLYGLHIAAVAGATLCTHRYWLGEAEAFTAPLFTTAFIAHIISINIITYLAYYIDKRASKRGSWRIPERTLHHFALIGGSPAALFAQKRLRHKTRKQSFKMIFWITATIQALILLAVIVA